MDGFPLQDKLFFALSLSLQIESKTFEKIARLL